MTEQKSAELRARRIAFEQYCERRLQERRDARLASIERRRTDAGSAVRRLMSLNAPVDLVLRAAERVV